jgi:formylglycine-generating enzyme required for sulfatase activity
MLVYKLKIDKWLVILIISLIIASCNQIPDSFSYLNPLDSNGDFDSVPPLAQFTVSSDSGIANETEFVFDASSSIEEDVPGTYLLFKWDFNNDGIWDTDWNSNPIIKRTFLPGNKKRQISLLVQGGRKLQSTISKTIFINSRPDAAFDWYLGPKDGDYYFDTFKSSDFEDGKQLNYRWDFNRDDIWDTEWSSSPKFLINFSHTQLSYISVEVVDTDFLTNSYTMEVVTGLNTMVPIEAGEFIMGSDNDFDDVKPSHTIYLDAYQIDLCEVSNSQYAIFLNTLFKNNELQIFPDQVRQGSYKMLNMDQYQKIVFENDSFAVVNNMERLPAEQITWYGAKIYAEYYGKRLPTEAEWEKAARGVDARTYPWGENTPDNSLSNINLFFDSPKAIGSFYPRGTSVYGCLDMIGNIREWCSDWYDNTYYYTTPFNNPQGGEGNYKVIRGGDWGSSINNSKTYRRFSHHPVQGTFYQIGFRCAN